MGNQLVWQERYNIGVSFIDEEHKKLFSILNKLFAYRGEEERNQWVCQEGIKYFKEHAMRHFTEEEAYMASISYIGFDTHRRLHDDFRRRILPALERELEQTGYSEEAISHFLGVCAGWLIGHTLTEDSAITGKTMSKWVDLLPEEEQAAMTQTVVGLMQDIFQLKPQVLSDCYGGERFGKGIYYRLNYGNPKGEKWEIVLIFEEKLIVKTIGSMMDASSDEMNEMLMNVVRYVAQQFVGRIKEQFALADSFEMKEENLLTYDQFRRTFDKQHPQFSLLLDTGVGYFAFCAIAPTLLQDDGTGSVSIKAENAMTEIRKYLKESQEEQANAKNKVLVVDDSEFFLKAMQELLEMDYEVTTAKSGLSAIRCITLDRPDLVLLDYEMPVCNGSQVLEMIRAEEETKDIPVIFLTGKVDKESVQKVIRLKPAGYLVKTLQPSEIKKGVDGFFRK